MALKKYENLLNGEKIKMVKLNSNSVAVDEIRDVKKAEKLLKKKF